jgi:hypothetical protein
MRELNEFGPLDQRALLSLVVRTLGPLGPKSTTQNNPQVFDIDGGRDRDRTCDPYHVKVVLFR